VWNRSEPALILVRLNDGVVRSYYFDMDEDKSSDHPSSIFFVLRLNQADRLDLVTSDYPAFDVSRNGATLTAFLVQKL
jgi:hypothetical protein